MSKPAPDNESTYRQIKIESTLHSAKTPETEILQHVQSHGYGKEATFAIKLALEEALVNAVKHGNDNDASKGVVVRYAVTSERAIIIVRDEGPGFSVEDVPDPTMPDRLTLPTGRGIMLMRAYMDEVSFRDNGREVYLMKRNSKT